MPSIVNWVILGDIHNQLKKLEELPKTENCGGIIISGDLTLVGGKKDAEKILAVCARQGKILAAQIGNMDKPEITVLLEEQGINLHGKAVKIHEKVTVIGVGGSNKTPFNTCSEFSEDEISALLSQALKEAKNHEYLVLVSHCPPLNTACDRISSGIHVGSQAIRDFIETVQPDFCICGHIHEAKAVDSIGKTVIINPGSLDDGGYVNLQLEEAALKAELAAI